ncbi:hypothetical protein DPEC_G00032150 [Dallia pectoralis]|uniref:Uncharacterized protein n=1 Tax=Dallia pectoralis TaxID=75939 RepID=A0ACC2HCE1_DALPE|nr:hypothetical protein DPEC_G00032150 [Dallia pectoralis]
MSSYRAKRRRILKGVERDKQEIAAVNNALLAVIPDFDQVNPSVNEHQHGMATSHGQTVTSEEQKMTVDEVYGPGEMFSSSTEDSEEEEDCLRTQLTGWAIDNLISHVSLSKLLTRDSRIDFQRLQNEKQAVMVENQALRESNARADQTLMLQHLGEFGDVVRSMDNKMDTMLQHFSANGSVGELSLPGDLLLPLDTPEDLALLDNSLRQDKELQEQFLRFLAIKCGRDLKTTVWRMLQSIFSNHLSINTTWTGAGDKACFRDMFLKTIVQRAIRKNPTTQDATDEAVQVNVMRYLKGASDREGGKRRRTAERDPQPTPYT